MYSLVNSTTGKYCSVVYIFGHNLARISSTNINHSLTLGMKNLNVV